MCPTQKTIAPNAQARARAKKWYKEALNGTCAIVPFERTIELEEVEEEGREVVETDVDEVDVRVEDDRWVEECLRRVDVVVPGVCPEGQEHVAAGRWPETEVVWMIEVALACGNLFELRAVVLIDWQLHPG